MKRTLLILASITATALSAHAQDYFSCNGNVDVTVHSAPSLTEIIQLQQMVAQQQLIGFQRTWLYQLGNAQRTFWIRAVPGLGAALRYNDWASAYSFWSGWFTQEQAYEKAYHRPSPAYLAAYNATFRANKK
jgi:hypothetical protein